MRRMGRNPRRERGAVDCRNRLNTTLQPSIGSLRLGGGRAGAPQIFWKKIRSNSVPNLTHDVKVPLDIVTSSQYRKQNLPGLEQMTKVCSGVPLASITRTALVEGPLVALV